MTKRLQVLIDDPEWREIQKTARAHRMTVAEWVRQALRAARRRGPSADVDRRLDAIQPAFNLLIGVVDEIFPIDRAALERAKAVVLGYPTLSARDAIHVATMQEHGVARIMTFDSGFDAVSVISRIRL